MAVQQARIAQMAKAFCMALLAGWLPLIAAAAAAPTVAVDGGAVRGTMAAGGQELLFRGIPFAAPPVEELRWRAPQAVVPWTGIRDASGPAPACVQNDQGWNHGDYLSGREDCLTLDIGTGALAGRRPVLVWIHGGSNRAGSPGDMITSPVVREGIVLVGIRYRLGIFGFLSSRTLSVESRGSSGNYGLMDQIAALRWIRSNIARFGGDPDNVTVAGESAGSQDVSLLLASPAARGLFAKAILESGTPGFGLPFRTREEAERIGDQAETMLGAQRDAAKLRATSVPALLAVDLRLHDDTLESDDYMWLRTTIDGDVLPRSPRELLAQAPPRPVIVGTNRIELDPPGGRPHRDSMVAKAFGANEARARVFYRLDEPDPPADPRRGDRDQQIATDLVFRCPAGNLADLLARRGAPVWRYEFDLAPGGARTRHSQEISYVFGEDRSASGLSLRPYWVRFARTGDPNGPGMPAWPRFTPAAGAYEAFEESGFTARTALGPRSCAWVDRL
jgi:para-nitrobenzyl esterase